MWYNIKNENDIKNLLDTVNNFHDSCIKEMSYLSGAFINKELEMYPINDKRILRILIQRQNSVVSTIELEFQGLVWLRLCPNNEHYTSEILEALLTFKNNLIYWCDSTELLEGDHLNEMGTCICAERLRWREIPEVLEDKLFYQTMKTGNDLKTGDG